MSKSLTHRGSGLWLRPATPEDANRLADCLARKTWHARPGPSALQGLRCTMQQVIAQVPAQSNAALLLASIGQQFVGYLQIQPFSWAPLASSHVAEITLVLRPACSARRLRATLTGLAVAWAQAAAYQQAICWVEKKESWLQSLALRCGWQIYGAYPQLASDAGHGWLDMQLLGCQLARFAESTLAHRLQRQLQRCLYRETAKEGVCQP